MRFEAEVSTDLLLTKVVFHWNCVGQSESVSVVAFFADGSKVVALVTIVDHACAQLACRLQVVIIGSSVEIVLIVTFQTDVTLIEITSDTIFDRVLVIAHLSMLVEVTGPVLHCDSEAILTFGTDGAIDAVILTSVALPDATRSAESFVKT